MRQKLWELHLDDLLLKVDPIPLGTVIDMHRNKKERKGIKSHLGKIEGISAACNKGKCSNCFKASCSHHCHRQER